MKKKNFWYLLAVALFVSACESSMDEDMSTINSAKGSGGIENLSLTRGTSEDVPFTKWVVGDKVGYFTRFNGAYYGPENLTISEVTDSRIEFGEPIHFYHPIMPHFFYGYYPAQASNSTDPTKVDVLPIPSVQSQIGTAKSSNVQFLITRPDTINSSQKLNFAFSHTYSYMEFRLSSALDGLVIKNVKLDAPENIAFTSAKVDITKTNTDPDFAKFIDLQGASKSITLNVSGDVAIPNSTTDYVSTFMTVLPFDGTDQILTLTITTTDDQEFTFEIDGMNYLRGRNYITDIRIERQYEPRNIRVLSLCEVGCLGEYDNTQKWNCNYGATYNSAHTKTLRRLLFEHFGPGKTVETMKISFEKTDISCKLNKLSAEYLERFDIIFLNNNARPDEATAQRIMNWLNKAENRVLMLGYDWKDACVSRSTKKPYCYTTTNYVIFRDHITGIFPHWYNGSSDFTKGNYGSCRQDMLIPVELNAKTSYFWQNGPFATNLSENSDLRYWVEDIWWGSAFVTDPNVIPLISYRDARNDNGKGKIHCKGPGDGGMVLGVDPTRRIVYIGDSEIFSDKCATSTAKRNARIDIDKYGNVNNFGKVIGNLWAWMIQEVTYKK